LDPALSHQGAEGVRAGNAVVVQEPHVGDVVCQSVDRRGDCRGPHRRIGTFRRRDVSTDHDDRLRLVHLSLHRLEGFAQRRALVDNHEGGHQGRSRRRVRPRWVEERHAAIL
jgi:hypothetical protein